MLKVVSMRRGCDGNGYGPWCKVRPWPSVNALNAELLFLKRTPFEEVECEEIKFDLNAKNAFTNWMALAKRSAAPQGIEERIFYCVILKLRTDAQIERMT